MAMPSLLKQRKCFACTINSQAQTTAPSHHQQPNTLDSNALDNTQPLSPVKNPGQYPDTITRRTPWTTPNHHHNALENTTIPSSAQHPQQHAATITTPSTTPTYNHQPRQHPATIISRKPSAAPRYNYQPNTLDNSQILISRTPLTTPTHHHQPNTLDNTHPPSPAKHP